MEVWLNGDECVRVPIIASCARVELGELGVAATVPVSLGSDDSRAVHASLREPRCTWRCRNRARALASVTLEGDECVRVPIIASCARIALASPRRALGELGELGVAATEPVSLGSDARRAVHTSLREPRYTWHCRNRARALASRLASVAFNGDECVRALIIAELCTHRLVELGELCTNIASSSSFGELGALSQPSASIALFCECGA